MGRGMAIVLSIAQVNWCYRCRKSAQTVGAFGEAGVVDRSVGPSRSRLGGEEWCRSGFRLLPYSPSVASVGCRFDLEWSRTGDSDVRSGSREACVP